jgi:DedD protein
MQEGSKRRLVGTAVVVLLLVIFLPMLLEDEPANPVPDSDLEIPPRPEVMEDLDAIDSEPPAETFAFPAAPELPLPDSYQDSAAAGADSPTAVESPDLPEPVSSAAAPAPRPAEDASRETVARSGQGGEESSPLPAQEGPGWVLQVSSLRERPRAEALQRELRAQGFPVFIEMAEVGGDTYHRVRVGPRTERSEMETMAASVKRKTGYQGQILRYP